MRLAIILVNYHTPRLLARAVESVLVDIGLSKLDGELIVIDNGSSEEDRARMENLPVRLFYSGSNLGYGRGINLGATKTDADILILMNADVAVFPGCLESLTRVLEDGVAAAGPRFFWDPGKCLMLPPTEKRTRPEEIIRRLAGFSEGRARRARESWRLHARNHWLANRPLISYELSGALLALRRDAWERTGPFDEGFKLYFEETDWLMRLKRQGLKAAYVPKAEAVHLYNQSTAREPLAAQWFADSADRFERRHYGIWFQALLGLEIPAKWGAMKPPPLLEDGLPEIKLGISRVKYSPPLWVEISPSPLLFPAAGHIIKDHEQERWALPVDVWQYLTPGIYYLQLVDSSGVEISQFMFNRAPGEDSKKNGLEYVC